MVDSQQLRLSGAACLSGLDFAIKSGGKPNYNLFAPKLDSEVLTSLRTEKRWQR
jgi:hypothetical protein